MSTLQNYLVWLCIPIGFTTSLLGCATWYEQMGFTKDESQALAAKDRTKFLEVKQQADSIFWESMSVAIAGAGTLLSGLLGKYLLSERKISKAVILGVENAANDEVKATIEKTAIALGVEDKLSKRVESLTL